jgi:hypothetical protein
MSANLLSKHLAAGAVSIPYSLTVGGVAVERIPWISAFVQVGGGGEQPRAAGGDVSQGAHGRV